MPAANTVPRGMRDQVNKTLVYKLFDRTQMQQSAEKIWSSAQEHLRSKLSADTYNMWFAPLRACAIDAQQVTLEAANEFCEVWLKDNYLGLLQDAVGIAAGRQLQIQFKAATGTGSLTRPPR